MKQDEIIEITRQAGGFSPTPEFLEAFAKLVAAKEREACAKVCAEDKNQAMDWMGTAYVGKHYAIYL